ncbi:hypothetical protein [Nostoc sp. 'Peltigera membranacea cyanobiont' N6]|uniref:hypothetical protein n=1 Tax=Nostoc sp. 'Peltigera membranacea cyanobiont' N6 TaxID=1261031 RepID=UPI0011B0CBC7|nr:hypothetical protein [Nostoc sp. 'Peltigera membranacea cyanobiont' N6]
MSSEFDEYKSNQNSELVKQVLVKAGGIIIIQNSKFKIKDIFKRGFKPLLETGATCFGWGLKAI